MDHERYGTCDEICHRAEIVPGYNVTSRAHGAEDAAGSARGRHRPDIEIDVDLSPEKSAVAPFDRAGRGQPAPRLRRAGYPWQYSQGALQGRIRPGESGLCRDRRRYNGR